MDDFIDNVRKYPCLWDINSTAYRDIGSRDMIWETVAKKCGIVNGKDAKNQWKRLRDSHREALRRRKASTRHSSINSRPWKYEHCMEFLLSQNRDASTSHSTNDNDDEHLQEVDEPSFELADAVIDNSASMSNQSQLSHDPKKRNSDKVLNILKEREIKQERRETYRDDLRQKILEQLTSSERARQRDPIADLFSSLCEKTRELPRHLQLRVQREIFNSVNRAEEEALHNENYNQSPINQQTNSHQ